MKITTNNAWREFKGRHEVPEKILASEFDWCDSDTGFIKYKGFWYHTSQFLKHSAENNWHGSHADSAFTGVLIRLSSDGELYQIASCRT
jgi:hypothetical protein